MIIYLCFYPYPKEGSGIPEIAGKGRGLDKERSGFCVTFILTIFIYRNGGYFGGYRNSDILLFLEPGVYFMQFFFKEFCAKIYKSIII